MIKGQLQPFAQMALRMSFLIDCIHWDSHIQWNFIPSLLEYLNKTLWARRSRLPQQGQSFTTPFTAETEISWFSELLGIFGIYFPFSHTRPALPALPALPEQLNPGAPRHEKKTAEPPDEQCILTAASSDCIWLRNALGWVLKSGVITLSYQVITNWLDDVWWCLIMSNGGYRTNLICEPQWNWRNSDRFFIQSAECQRAARDVILSC